MHASGPGGSALIYFFFALPPFEFPGAGGEG